MYTDENRNAKWAGNAVLVFAVLYFAIHFAVGFSR